MVKNLPMLVEGPSETIARNLSESALRPLPSKPRHVAFWNIKSHNIADPPPSSPFLLPTLPDARQSGKQKAKTCPPIFSFTNFFDLYFHHFHRLTKNHISLLQTPMQLSSQVGNIRSRINPPNAFLLASKRLRAGGQSPPADEGPSDRSDEEIPGAVRGT